MQTATLIVPADNNLHLQTENGQVVVSSRVVAERFGKQHKHVLDSIEELIKGVAEKSADLFIPSKYQHPQNKQWYPEYLLTKKGFTLLAMGFTGQEALKWKLNYIEAFEKMEQALKDRQQMQSMSMEDIIIYQMQQSKLMKEQLEQTQTVAIEAKATAEQATKQMEIVKDAMLLDHDSWRKDCNNIINKVAKERGGTKEAYQQVRDEVYNLLQQRAGASLKTRVINKQDRMRREGISKSKVDKVSQIDVIAEDKRLKEIYIAVVKEMAIKYGVA